MTPSTEEKERGYRAAAVLIEEMLRSAEKDLPKRRSYKHQKLALYREGYYDGLLTAHCLLVLGEYPLKNAYQIMNVLRDQDAAACRKTAP